MGSIYDSSLDSKTARSYCIPSLLSVYLVTMGLKVCSLIKEIMKIVFNSTIQR